MTDTKQLIENLRDPLLGMGPKSPNRAQAADAIERLEAEREQLRGWLSARESSALVQSETADRRGTLRWQALGRAEAYRDALQRTQGQAGEER